MQRSVGLEKAVKRELKGTFQIWSHDCVEIRNPLAAWGEIEQTDCNTHCSKQRQAWRMLRAMFSRVAYLSLL